MTTIDQRDLAIVRLVAQFSQLSAQHIQQVIFADHASHTPADRTLKRLVERRFLHRIERRIVGGARGGSGVYVYQLGLEGHKLCWEGRWVRARAISYHSLAIADAYVALHRLQRQGSLIIKGFSTEPDCHLTIGRYELKPDLYAELVRPDSGKSIRLMFEVDMGTQGQRQITDKFLRYWQARQVAEPEQWPDNQLVLFVAIDDQRAGELRWLLERGDKEQQSLFRVQTADKLEEALA